MHNYVVLGTSCSTVLHIMSSTTAKVSAYENIDIFKKLLKFQKTNRSEKCEFSQQSKNTEKSKKNRETNVSHYMEAFCHNFSLCVFVTMKLWHYQEAKKKVYPHGKAQPISFSFA